MKEIFSKAVEGGLKINNKWQFVTANRFWVVWLDGNGTEGTVSTSVYFIDPLFWQSLGKALGWGNGKVWQYSIGNEETSIDEGMYHWHKFISHLASGADAESFFKDLLTKHNE